MRQESPAETGSSSLRIGGGPASDWDASLPRRGVDFRALKNIVSMASVLELLDWKAISQNGQQLRGPCPIHKSTSERSRSFSVNVEKHAFQCFGCGKKGNQLDLFAAATGLPLLEAAWTLVGRLGLAPSQLEKRKP